MKPFWRWWLAARRSSALPFHIDIRDIERAYLDSLPLSPQAKERLDRFVEEFIAEIPDEFRLNPDNRLGSDSPHFRIHHIILDRWGDGRVHAIDFFVRDDKAKFGALLIVFIDHH